MKKFLKSKKINLGDTIRISIYDTGEGYAKVNKITDDSITIEVDETWTCCYECQSLVNTTMTLTREDICDIEKKDIPLNFETQFYKGIPLNLINRKYGNLRAKRFVINHTNQNVWIPNKYLTFNGTIKSGANLDFVFRKSQNQLMIAGIHQAIPGIKRKTKEV